jgi:hypothetical protein
MTRTASAEVPIASDQRRAIGDMPPGPRWPRALQTVWWAARPASLMSLCRRRYGDVFSVRPYAFGNIVVLADP